MHRITIMTLPGDARCEQVTEAIRRVVRATVMMEIVDITKEQDLLEKYREAVPVVLVDGVERFRRSVGPQGLTELLMDEPGEQLTGIAG
jgi:hypothetical protein